MPSGWTESGIDWNNLSTQSPREVIRELYVAVSERNYWIKYFGSSGYNNDSNLEPIDYDVTQRHRTKDQIIFICSSLNDWLKPTGFVSRSAQDRNDFSNTYQGAFIDLNIQSNYEYNYYLSSNNGFSQYNANDNSNSHEFVNLGWNTYNADEFGALEILINSSLNFIRLYDNNESFRFTYEMMKSTYDVLNNLNFMRFLSYRENNNINNSTGARWSDFTLNSRYLDNLGNKTFFYNNPKTFIFNDTFTNSRSDLYNTYTGAPISGTIVNNRLLVRGRNLNAGQTSLWSMTSRNNLIRFNEIGYNGNTFRNEDFDIKTLNYIYSYEIIDIGTEFINQGDIDLTGRPLGWTELNNNNENVISENTADKNVNPNYEGIYTNLGYSKPTDGLIPDSVENLPPDQFNQIESRFADCFIPLINFNKEGFLKYYTE